MGRLGFHSEHSRKSYERYKWGRGDTPPVYSHIIHKRTEHTGSVGYLLADSLVSNWVGLRAPRPCDVMRGNSALSRGEAWGPGEGVVLLPSQVFCHLAPFPEMDNGQAQTQFCVSK